MRLLLITGFLGLLSSCFLQKDFRRQTFTYTAPSGQLNLILPKGWNKVDTYTDSAGGRIQVYKYGNGAYFYIGKDVETAPLQFIDTSKHIPREHLYGGLFFKGQDSSALFWREVRMNDLRLGYRFVPDHQESLFDSALNFVRPAR